MLYTSVFQLLQYSVHFSIPYTSTFYALQYARRLNIPVLYTLVFCTLPCSCYYIPAVFSIPATSVLWTLQYSSHFCILDILAHCTTQYSVHQTFQYSEHLSTPYTSVFYALQYSAHLTFSLLILVFHLLHKTEVLVSLQTSQCPSVPSISLANLEKKITNGKAWNSL